MQEITGKGVYGGIALGTVFVYGKPKQTIERHRVADVKKELTLFDQALQTANAQLEALYQKALSEVGEANAQIFQIHQMMLNDDDYGDSVRNIITSQQVNAAYAVATTADIFGEMFQNTGDDYMMARAVDVADISERLIGLLTGQARDMGDLEEPVILAADDLTPSETVQLDKSKVLAFVTVKGSANSHTAILARTMNIPAVIGAEGILDCDGKQAAVDGAAGKVYVEPDEQTLSAIVEKQRREKEKAQLLQTLKGKDTVTADGRALKLYANIGSTADLGGALANDAAGIGLMRSEFLYLENSDFPTEQQQFAAYKKVLEGMAGRPVIIRTLDIGADKQAGYFKLPHEENPAMGMRAIRICLTQTDIFETQLRALYRASAYGSLSIMFPMITSVWEVERILDIAGKVKAELKAEGIPFGEEVPLGIMIETPAAAIISAQLAEKVDFFSIGTNDLTQYTLALDRQNTALDPFYDAHHPAVLELIRMVVENAHKCGIWAGICGELGADTKLTETFLRMGVDELSVSPPQILPIRKLVRELDLSKNGEE